MRIVILTAASVLTGITLLLSIWSCAFGFIAGYIGLFTICIGIVFSILRKSGKALLLVPVIYVLVNIVLLPSTIHDYNTKRAEYVAQLAATGELGFLEKCSIYGLNIVMAILALPLYPEVSVESLYLMVPSNEGRRTFQNGFFLKSKKIREAIDSQKPNMRVTWSVRDYSLGNPEAKFALALNPCSLEVKKSMSDTVYQAKVRVEYPMSCEVTLLKKPIEVKVEEGLFGYLQKAGWLHPYDAVWIGRYGGK